MPTLVIDGVAHTLQHPSEAGMLLGLTVPPALRDARQTAWDLDAIVEAWLELAERTPWAVLTAPGVVLRRTPLALTVDALVGVAALTGALWTGWFHWPGNPATGETGDASIGPYEASVVAAIADRGDLLAFGRRVAAAWHDALAEHDEALVADPAQPVRTPRGRLAVVELLEAQRLHAAGHYRQATASLAAAGAPVPEFDLATLHGLVLPETLV
ncbi:MAG: hypothetical protein HOQ28_10805 [Thermoleophilia bacterium]|nr:hypothetical protein [Thermoleophilia bacterium]